MRVRSHKFLFFHHSPPSDDEKSDDQQETSFSSKEGNNSLDCSVINTISFYSSIDVIL